MRTAAGCNAPHGEQRRTRQHGFGRGGAVIHPIRPLSPMAPSTPQRSSQQSGPDAIRVSEALSGESTQEVGSDATNMASPADSVPAVAADPQGDALQTVMRHDEGECAAWSCPAILRHSKGVQRAGRDSRRLSTPGLGLGVAQRRRRRRPPLARSCRLVQGRCSCPSAPCLSLSPCPVLPAGDITSGGGGDGGSSGLKPVTLRTAPQDARFPTTNQVGLGGWAWGASLPPCSVISTLRSLRCIGARQASCCQSLPAVYVSQRVNCTAGQSAGGLQVGGIGASV